MFESNERSCRMVLARPSMVMPLPPLSVELTFSDGARGLIHARSVDSMFVQSGEKCRTRRLFVHRTDWTKSKTYFAKGFFFLLSSLSIGQRETFKGCERLFVHRTDWTNPTPPAPTDKRSTFRSSPILHPCVSLAVHERADITCRFRRNSHGPSRMVHSHDACTGLSTPAPAQANNTSACERS
jgi:hypothetical protein